MGRLEAMEVRKREELEQKVIVEERMIIKIRGIVGKSKLHESPIYFEILNLQELIDWIWEMENYFEFEWIKDPMSVRFYFTRLKSHASLWWLNYNWKGSLMEKKESKDGRWW